MSKKMEKKSQIRGSKTDAPPMLCDEIQSVLFDYMTRELGAARSDLVREHLRKCETCTRAAADIKSTLQALQAASRIPTGTEEKLSPERKAFLLRAFMHPVLNWISLHHVLVSICSGILAFLLAILLVRHMKMAIDDGSEGITQVTIGRGDADKYK